MEFPVPAPKRPRADYGTALDVRPAPNPASQQQRNYRVRGDATPAPAAGGGGGGGSSSSSSSSSSSAYASGREDEWARIEALSSAPLGAGRLSASSAAPSAPPSVRQSRFGPSPAEQSQAVASFAASFSARHSSSASRPGGTAATPLSLPSTATLPPAGAAEGETFDREFYDTEEFGVAVEEGGGGGGGGEGRFLGDETKFKAREDAMARARARGESKIPGMSAKKSALLADQEAWEVNRLRTSGAGGAGGGSGADALEEPEEQAHLLVHNRRPPFLMGRDVGMGGLGGGGGGAEAAVAVVKDPTSDIAQLARRPSEALRRSRERRDRAKMRQKFWELGGSKMGDAVGVKGEAVAAEKGDAEVVQGMLEAAAGEAAAAAAAEAEGSASSSSSSSYASALSGKAASTSAFTRALTLAQQREFLPAYACRSELLSLVSSHQVVIVVGETGSGKTTQLAQYLHEEGYTAAGASIGCTQPRRVAAVSVASRVAAEVGCACGGLVGYSIRFEDCTTPATRIKFMTDGVLLRETLRDSDLDAYSAIIMDEAHERSLNTDVLFGILRGVVARRRDFRLIVTSATMDSAKFGDFFGGAPVFTIPGRTFPVARHWAKSVPEDYVDAAVRCALTIHLSNPPGSGDILVFMTGQEDIEATCELLAERVGSLRESKAVPPLLVLPMYSQLPADLQAKIFEAGGAGVRKVIVSTNIAETSLTVDGVAYIVDPGLSKVKVYNPRIGMDALTLLPVSQASANQRAGRAGRTGPGQAYRLYPEATFRKDLLLCQVPEIQRTNLGNVVLLLKSLGVRDVRTFPFMDAPPPDNLSASEYALWVMGALDDSGGLTPAGKRMVDFPVDPPLAKMLHTAAGLGCVQEVATVVALLSVPGIFFRPSDRQAEADALREKFYVPESDHLTLLNVYTQWKRAGGSAQWCAAHYIHVKALRKAEEVLAQLLDICASRGVPLSSSAGDWDVVRKAVCSGYFFNAARLKGIGEYANLLNGLPATLHPSSALFGLGYTPPYVVYHELTLTTKEYMSCVTAVEPAWLAEMGPAFFSLRGVGGSASSSASSSSAASAGSGARQQQAQRLAESAPTPSLASLPSSTPLHSSSSDSRGPSVVRSASAAAPGSLAARIAEAKEAAALRRAASRQ